MPPLRHLLLLLPLLLSGCFTREIRILVEPDGSGFLETTTRVRQALLDYARRETGLPPEEWWFTPETLQKAARNYGATVRYHSHHIEDDPMGKRFIARFEFEDIRSLRIRLDTSLPFLLTPPDRSRHQTLPAYRFETPAPGVLLVRPPPAPPAPPHQPYSRVEAPEVARQRDERHRSDLKRLLRHGNPFDLRGNETPEALATALGHDIRFRLTLEAPTGFHTHNATHLEGDTILLFDFRAEELLKDPAFRTRASEGTLHQLTWGEITRLPGAVTETRETLVAQPRPASDQTAE